VFPRHPAHATESLELGSTIKRESRKTRSGLPKGQDLLIREGNNLEEEGGEKQRIAYTMTLSGEKGLP